jgi:hypothetical protein
MLTASARKIVKLSLEIPRILTSKARRIAAVSLAIEAMAGHASRWSSGLATTQRNQLPRLAKQAL